MWARFLQDMDLTAATLAIMLMSLTLILLMLLLYHAVISTPFCSFLITRNSRPLMKEYQSKGQSMHSVVVERRTEVAKSTDSRDSTHTSRHIRYKYNLGNRVISKEHEVSQVFYDSLRNGQNDLELWFLPDYEASGYPKRLVEEWLTTPPFHWQFTFGTVLLCGAILIVPIIFANSTGLWYAWVTMLGALCVVGYTDTLSAKREWQDCETKLLLEKETGSPQRSFMESKLDLV
mmetsp:Transcript_20795/g.34375  ORF Transcript_20795/g.34375 Transcript_20795/m.34375 type:complete len:233 (-) Transcript_20795:142-840(-)